MTDLVYFARSLVESNLGWFYRTRETLGEAAGRERAININLEIFEKLFPEKADAEPIEISTRYFDGDALEAGSRIIKADARTIRNQGGGKNWRLAGDAIEGSFYDARLGDILFMAFDKATNVLSWVLIRKGNEAGRSVPATEAQVYSHISSVLGAPRGSMWFVAIASAMNIISALRTLYPEAGKLLMEEKALMQTWQADLESAGVRVGNDVHSRLVLALKAKRFVILSGLSGSGKTLLARALAKWLSEEGDQYVVVPVGANWTSSDQVLGYANALDATHYFSTEALNLLLRAMAAPTKPHFLILDEMNLSHVERYFSVFLSAIETVDEPIALHEGPNPRGNIPHRIPALPKNLYIIGTVNVDETTYMFSPKVLDSGI